tara:strand:+ start:80 stop:334 length:255 start_codon:yes stop_codon:yes gene_type:complete
MTSKIFKLNEKLFKTFHENKPIEPQTLIKDFYNIKVEIKKMIAARKCSWCQKDVGKFRDRISFTEYNISGFCQECQDLEMKELN